MNAIHGRWQAAPGHAVSSLLSQKMKQITLRLVISLVEKRRNVLRKFEQQDHCEVGQFVVRGAVHVLRCILVSVVLLTAVACKNTYTQTPLTASPLVAPLRPNSRVYVAMSEDALYKKESVPQSGRRAALAVETAFRRHTKNVFLGKLPESLEDTLNHARELACEYAAIALIQKWEDHPTDWNGIPDRLDLRIDLVSVESGIVLQSTLITGRGKVMTDGEEAPQDLLAEPVDKFVRSLFRITYTPSALQK